jgi:hypothetical protein
MKKTIAVLVLALLPLLAVADVVVPPETTGGTATQEVRRAWPVVFLSVAGVALVILIAARRRKAANRPQ